MSSIYHLRISCRFLLSHSRKIFSFRKIPTCLDISWNQHKIENHLPFTIWVCHNHLFKFKIGIEIGQSNKSWCQFLSLRRNRIHIGEGISIKIVCKRFVIHHRINNNCVITNKHLCPLELITIWVCKFHLI